MTTHISTDFCLFKMPVGSVSVLYPKLALCADLEPDKFWKTLYQELSIGKNPNYLYVANDSINYNKKQNISYCFTDKEPKDIIRDVKTLLLQSTTISSKKDNSNKQSLIQRAEIDLNEALENKWSSVRKKNAKDLHLVNFVIEQKHKYDLSSTQSVSLLNLIKHLFIMKHIVSKDVVMEDKKIVSINRLTYDPELKQMVYQYPEIKPNKTQKNLKEDDELAESLVDIDKDDALNEFEDDNENECLNSKFEKYFIHYQKNLVHLV